MKSGVNYLNSQEKQADLIYKAVKTSSVSPSLLERGDLVVITADNDDVVGTIRSLSTAGKFTTVSLNTTSGVQTHQITNNNFIHIIEKAAMLSLKNHEDYERTDDEVDVIAKNKDEHKERPEYGVESSEKSNLPTSKISSLSLRKKKEA